jgi:hypothetical protein
MHRFHAETPENAPGRINIQIPCECGGLGLLERLDDGLRQAWVCQWCGRMRFLLDGVIVPVEPRIVSLD